MVGWMLNLRMQQTEFGIEGKQLQLFIASRESAGHHTGPSLRAEPKHHINSSYIPRGGAPTAPQTPG
jgi:hypothetical protein